MLVFRRKLGESLVIANNIRVTILEMQGGRVKLGIAAPSAIPVHRKEIYAKIANCPASGGCVELAVG